MMPLILWLYQFYFQNACSSTSFPPTELTSPLIRRPLQSFLITLPASFLFQPVFYQAARAAWMNHSSNRLFSQHLNIYLFLNALWPYQLCNQSSSVTKSSQHLLSPFIICFKTKFQNGTHPTLKGVLLIIHIVWENPLSDLIFLLCR